MSGEDQAARSLDEPETLKERTWRERQEANDAVADALERYSIQETALNEARLAYRAALKRQGEAVQRNVDAWKSPATQPTREGHP